MWGGKYDTVPDIIGEWTAARESTASSDQQSAIERAKGERIACCNHPVVNRKTAS